MHSQIKSIIWSDDRFGSLDPEGKLAILWLMTNSRLDLCGFCKPEKRWFEFETGMSFEALQRACKGFPGSIETMEDGTLFIRNYLRHQCSRNGAVSSHNKIVVGAVKHALGRHEALRRAFFEANPELEKLASSMQSTLKPLEAHRRVKGKGKGKEKDEVQSEEEKLQPDHSRWAHAIVAAYPRREDTERCLLEVMGQINSGIEPETILNGTRAMAAAIQQLPSGHLNRYVIGAHRFFRDKRWQDDPATILRTGAGPNGEASGPLDLGGRSGRTMKLDDLGKGGADENAA